MTNQIKKQIMSSGNQSQHGNKAVSDKPKRSAGATKKTAENEELIPKLTDGRKPDLVDMKSRGSKYSTVQVERGWYSWWEKSGFFKPRQNKDGKRFVIILPPPNVTGELHLGHALTVSIQDALVRFNRMNGLETIWVPGTDHAGIATQVRVEKKIHEEKKLERNQITRDFFLEEAHKWVDSKSGTILAQLRDIGSSLDWDNYYYTLDSKRSESVIRAFVKLFDDGLIYRRERLVNWDCALQTAISDAEVEYRTITGRTRITVPNHKTQHVFGVMTHFYYQIADENGKPTDEKVEIATTRLETILGDEAVAVHPNDKRYMHLHGKSVYHPFRKITIPIITDAILVDMEFGTGIVKVTPAHDPNDFEVGLRHNLRFTNIYTKDGCINDICEEFKGMRRYDARVAIGKRMKELGLFKEEKDHTMRLGITQRGHDVCEQVVTKQWFVNTTEMAARAIKVVEDGQLKIVPNDFEVDWRVWHENIRPWCISRQLMWGHRIPAYQVYVDDKLQEEGNEWVAAESEEIAISKAAEKLGVDKSRVKVVQDNDVLDTWFSSALLPFTATGWSYDAKLLEKYYPNDVLETGWDILTFWVSRMVMMSLQLCNKVPFHTVLLHPLVRDAQGRKMSKSLGNVIDPRHVINGVSLETLLKEIEEGNFDEKERKIASDGRKADFPNGVPQCGADAMRFSLASFAGANRTANLDVNNIISHRNFCNKMWNAIRFSLRIISPIEYNVEDDPVTFTIEPLDVSKLSTYLETSRLSELDRWVLCKLQTAVRLANVGFRDFKMADAVTGLNHFFHDEFCSQYLEGIKSIITDSSASMDSKMTVSAVLYVCIETSLRLLHPFMPYVTEELWQHLPRIHNSETIMFAPYPVENKDWGSYDTTLVDNAILTVTSIRSVRANYNIQNKQKLEAKIATSVTDFAKVAGFVSSVAGLSKLEIVPKNSAPDSGYANEVVNSLIEVRINLENVVDFAKELERLKKKRVPLAQQLQKYEQKVSNPNYASKVDSSVRALEASKMEDLKTQIESIDRMIESLSSRV